MQAGGRRNERVGSAAGVTSRLIAKSQLLISWLRLKNQHIGPSRPPVFGFGSDEIGEASQARNDHGPYRSSTWRNTCTRAAGTGASTDTSTGSMLGGTCPLNIAELRLVMPLALQGIRQCDVSSVLKLRSHGKIFRRILRVVTPQNK